MTHSATSRHLALLIQVKCLLPHATYELRVSNLVLQYLWSIIWSKELTTEYSGFYIYQ